jgi:hypothetical protein
MHHYFWLANICVRFPQSDLVMAHNTVQTVLATGIASLTFVTNKQVFWPFGVPSLDKPFDVQGPVYGFHGAVSRGSPPEILTAIGIWKGRAGKQPATFSKRSLRLLLPDRAFLCYAA